MNSIALRDFNYRVEYRDIHYDPALGQFLSADPIGFASGDANHYRYVLNNPQRYTDPEGKEIEGIGQLLIECAKNKTCKGKFEDVMKAIENGIGALILPEPKPKTIPTIPGCDNTKQICPTQPIKVIITPKPEPKNFCERK